jgi:hypothetical protein
MLTANERKGEPDLLLSPYTKKEEASKAISTSYNDNVDIVMSFKIASETSSGSFSVYTSFISFLPSILPNQLPAIPGL